MSTLDPSLVREYRREVAMALIALGHVAQIALTPDGRRGVWTFEPGPAVVADRLRVERLLLDAIAEITRLQTRERKLRCRDS